MMISRKTRHPLALIYGGVTSLEGVNEAGAESEAKRVTLRIERMGGLAAQ